MLVGVSPIDVSKRNAEAVLTTGTDNCESDICVEQETVNTPLSQGLQIFSSSYDKKTVTSFKRRGILLGYGKFA